MAFVRLSVACHILFPVRSNFSLQLLFRGRSLTFWWLLDCVKPMAYGVLVLNCFPRTLQMTVTHKTDDLHSSCIYDYLATLMSFLSRPCTCILDTYIPIPIVTFLILLVFAHLDLVLPGHPIYCTFCKSLLRCLLKDSPSLHSFRD